MTLLLSWWEKGWLGCTSTFFSWSTACVWCLAPNQNSYRIIFLSSTPHPHPTPPHPLPSLSFLLHHFSISSKYRPRRRILHLSVSHSHINRQVHAGLMRQFACSGKRKKRKKKERKKKGAHLRFPLKAKHRFWAENSTMDTKVSFKLKGPVDH